LLTKAESTGKKKQINFNIQEDEPKGGEKIDNFDSMRDALQSREGGRRQ
jgi:hypothetical protein